MEKLLYGRLAIHESVCGKDVYSKGAYGKDAYGESTRQVISHA